MNWTAVSTLAQLVSTLAVVISVAYLALQVRIANRLARAEASRTPSSDLNSLNASFGTDPVVRQAMHKLVQGAVRADLDVDHRIAIDFYLISITNLQEQLAREIQAGTLDSDTQDFGGAGLFALPYYRSSWALYRQFFSSEFSVQFENRLHLDPTIDAKW